MFLEFFLNPITLTFIFIFFYFNIYMIFKTFKVDDIEVQNFKSMNEMINILIQEKFNYYLYTEILPIYKSDKLPEDNQIDQIKNSIYTSIIGGFSKNFKMKYENIYTEKGFQLMIFQKVLLLFNNIDYDNYDSFNLSKLNEDDKPLI